MLYVFRLSSTLIHRSSWSDLVLSVHKSPIEKIHRNDGCNATEEDSADDNDNDDKEKEDEKRPLTIHSAFYMDENRQVGIN